MAECLAAVVTGFNEPLQVRSVQIPELEPTAGLMRVDAATLCGTDGHFWHGALRDENIPYIPGHETAGTLVEIAGDRRDVMGEPLKVGDRVISAYPFWRSLLLLHGGAPTYPVPQWLSLRPGPVR